LSTFYLLTSRNNPAYNQDMEKDKPFSTRLTPSIIKRLKKAAQDSGLKMSAVMKQAAELWLKENAQ